MKTRKPNIVPQAAVLAWLAEKHPDLEWEVERAWVWIVTDLAPLHKKCACAECAERAAVRKSLMDFDGVHVGFIFARGDHELPSGKTSRWAHHAEKPIRFTKGSKGKSEGESDQPQQISDAALLAALLGG